MGLYPDMETLECTHVNKDTTRVIWVDGESSNFVIQREHKRVTCPFILRCYGYNMTLGGDGGTCSGAANPFYERHHAQNRLKNSSVDWCSTFSR